MGCGVMGERGGRGVLGDWETRGWEAEESGGLGE